MPVVAVSAYFNKGSWHHWAPKVEIEDSLPALVAPCKKDSVSQVALENQQLHAGYAWSPFQSNICPSLGILSSRVRAESRNMDGKLHV